MSAAAAETAPPWEITTLPQMFARAVAGHAGDPALRHKVGGESVTITYGELDRRSAALAIALAQVLGVRTGELVALVANNRPEWMLCSLAIHSIGAVDVPRG